MLAGSLPARPARPVADAPLHALADTEALAKGWLLTLVARAPLARAGALSTAELARDAPPLCGAITAALASEAELDRLRPGGDLAPLAARAGRLAGAVDPAGAAGAVAALRSALWSEVTDALHRPEPELVAALAARLGHVCDIVAGAALGGGGGPAAAAPAVAAPAVAAPAPQAPAPGPEPEPPPAAPGPRLAPVPDVPAAGEAPAPPVPADVFPSVGAVAPDERQEPWATAVVRRLERLAASGRPCAVLAIEVADAERLLAADLRGEARQALDRAERAVRSELRPSDAAVREREGRLWVVAGGTNLEGARALGRRLADAVSRAAALHGAPLRASVGLAVSPDDGTDPAALVAHADEGVFAARAAGIDLA